MIKLIKEEYNGVKLYVEANIDKFRQLGKKYNCFLYGDVKTRFGEVYLDGWEKTGSDVDAFCDTINKLANRYDIDAYVMKTKPDTFSIVFNEE